MQRKARRFAFLFGGALVSIALAIWREQAQEGDDPGPRGEAPEAFLVPLSRHAPRSRAHEQDWKAELDRLGAPAEVRRWTDAQPIAFEKAWARCDDPYVRIWLAYADGVSHSQIGAAVAWLLEHAVEATNATPPQRAALERAMVTVFDRFRDREAATAASSIEALLHGPSDDTTQQATAIALLLGAGTRPANAPHGTNAADAEKALRIALARAPTPSDADKFLSAALRSNGYTAIPLELDGLTDRELVGAVYVRVFARHDPPQLVLLVAAAVEVERAAKAGRLGHFLHERDSETTRLAIAAYEKMGRRDDAVALREALRAPDDEEVSSSRLAAKEDAIPALAELIRRYSDTLTENAEEPGETPEMGAISP